MPNTNTITMDNDASVFENLAGVMLDGSDPADAVNLDAILRQHAEFGPANADADTEAWLEGLSIEEVN